MYTYMYICIYIYVYMYIYTRWPLPLVARVAHPGIQADVDLALRDVIEEEVSVLDVEARPQLSPI